MTAATETRLPPIHNIAQDNSQVDVQIGVLHGNATFYSVGDHNTPQQQFRVGVNFLRAGVARRAEELIGEAVMNGFRSPEVVYHWMLAILSGQSLEFLTANDFTKLRTARTIAEESARDQWGDAIGVVTSFLDCAVDQEIGNSARSQIDDVVAALERLPVARREEITANLDMLLSGTLQGSVEKSEVEHARKSRHLGNRKERVPLFFEPVPEPPRLIYREPRPVARSSLASLVLGSLLGIIVLRTLIPILLATNTPLTLAAAASWTAGSVLFLSSVPKWFLYRRRHTPGRMDTVQSGLGWKPAVLADERQFQYRVTRALYKAFGAYAADTTSRKAWLDATKPHRKAIARELTEFYQDVKVNQIYWLVKHHARVAAIRWRQHGTLLPAPERFQQTLTLRCVSSIALLALAAALIWVLASSGSLPVVLLTLLGLLAAVLCLPGASALMQRWFQRGMDLAKARQQLEVENAAYQAWVSRLKTQPTDVEMGRWLQFDLQHLKATAMEEYGLTHGDIIAHLVLTEPGERCLRARYVYGPVRYSRYIVTIFLLTNSGVRQWSTTLDFATGDQQNQQRQSFRYDAIAIAKVAELGRQSRTSDPETGRVLLSRALRVLLVDGNDDAIDVRIESFGEGLSDAREQDPQQLYELAIDSSGINSALRVLEAVAADGKQWIKRDLERRRRHARMYADGDPAKVRAG